MNTLCDGINKVLDVKSLVPVFTRNIGPECRLHKITYSIGKLQFILLQAWLFTSPVSVCHKWTAMITNHENSDKYPEYLKSVLLDPGRDWTWDLSILSLLLCYLSHRASVTYWPEIHNFKSQYKLSRYRLCLLLKCWNRQKHQKWMLVKIAIKLVSLV